MCCCDSAGWKSVQEMARPQENIAREKIEDFLDEFIRENMERSHAPGLVIVIVQGDQVLISKGYGYADLENRIPMTTQTGVRAGSVSKSLTATAVLQLVEKGILELDAPVSNYITDIDLEDDYGLASTVRQLLNHMGGYTDIRSSPVCLPASWFSCPPVWIRPKPSAWLSTISRPTWPCTAVPAYDAASGFSSMAQRVASDPLCWTWATWPAWRCTAQPPPTITSVFQPWAPPQSTTARRISSSAFTS